MTARKKAALDRLPGQGRVADWLDGLSAHDDNVITIDADKFDPSFERGVMRIDIKESC